MTARRSLVAVTGTVRELSSSDNLLGYRRYYESETAPGGTRAVGDIWLQTSTGIVFEWFVAASSSVWVAWENADEAAAPYLTNADIEITDSTKGLILKSPNGTRWRMTINNSGVPVFTSL